MKFYGRISNVMRQLLIPISIVAILFTGAQQQHFSSTDESHDTLQQISCSHDNFAILPIVLKNVAVDFYSLPEVLYLKQRSASVSLSKVRSFFENTYCFNVYYVFTSIHAP